MELVIIGGQYRRIEAYLKTYDFKDFKVTIQKVERAKIFLSINSESDFHLLERTIKQAIKKDKILHNADFAIYKFFHGKIDLAQYLPEEKKNKLSYYK